MKLPSLLRIQQLFACSLIFGVALATGCGNSSPGEGSLGGSCDASADSPCEGNLECTSSGDAHTCTYPAGESCQPENDDLERGGCGPGAKCTVPIYPTTAEGMGGESGAGDALCLIEEGGACDPDNDYCEGDLTCAETTDGENRCFGRVVLRGLVKDTSDDAPIEAAHVIALDHEGSAVTDVSVSTEKGQYLLDIPVIRNEDGSPAEATFTLNGSAQDYQPFPSGIRVALPISTKDATQEAQLYVIESALTDIGLIPLGAGDRVLASGAVAGLGETSDVSGLLVVASGDAGTFTTITDLGGEFTLFNLPDGEYTLKTYGAGIQIGESTLSVAGKEISDLLLSENEAPTTEVSGNIQIVNAPGGSLTSVILVVEETFNETAARGEVPRGLRAPASGPVSISGDFTIKGVPEGNYVVLAAYENDGLVRDPDTNISGTGFVRIQVTSEEPEMTISESFKVTEALAAFAPSSDRADGKPLLEWADDSSEDWYDVYVFDAFGDEVWSSLNIPGASGSDNVTMQYDGPMIPGMYYQFRVTSWRQPGNGEPAPISATEDLKGVFFSTAQ